MFPEQTPLSANLGTGPAPVFYHGDPSRTEVFISVDDCLRWANVEKDVETARAKGVQITLFPVGMYIDAHRELAGRVLQEAVSYGDEIGNHTYSHSLAGPQSVGNWMLRSRPCEPHSATPPTESRS